MTNRKENACEDVEWHQLAWDEVHWLSWKLQRTCRFWKNIGAYWFLVVWLIAQLVVMLPPCIECDYKSGWYLLVKKT